MHRIFAAVAALTLVMSGCGGSDPSTDSPVDEPTSTTSATPTPSAEPEPEPTLALAPGRVGSVEVGMSKSEAVSTGLMEADVPLSDESPCDAITPLKWLPPYDERIDVLTTSDGTIVSMGVLGDQTVETTEGIHLGSTLQDILDAYGAAASPAQEAGFDQSGVFVNEGDDWLGFLFNESFTDVSPSAEVHFMEVTSGSQPSLIRDGC